MLYLDKDALDTAKSNYSTYAQDMSTLKTTLEKAVDDIRSGWKTDAGDEFFKKFDDEWKKNLDDYIKVINHMSSNMQIAKNKYQTIFDEADELKL
jgi:WXG100 family type VII secretion target